MTNEDANQNGTNNRQNKITTKDPTTKETMPSSSTTKTISRCVSLCADGEKEQIHPSPSSDKSTNRKRPRPDFALDRCIEKPVLFAPMQNKKRNPFLTKENKHPNDLGIGQVGSLPYPQVKKHLHIPMPCKADEHILLNDNSLDDGPCTPFAPASPVRSVVSCDGSQFELEMKEVSDSTIDLGETSETCRQTNAAAQNDDIGMSSNTCAFSNVSDSLKLHVRSLRIEASLSIMKPLLSKLMGNIAHNRKGTFNKAVDHVAMGLKDYTKIVKKPMDLGTVKTFLHSNTYSSHEDVAADIRLCFENAMLFNPPLHPVHEAAKSLLGIFDSSYVSVLRERSSTPTSTSPFYLPPAPHTCQACRGRTCKICHEKCLSLEPNLVICAGAQCGGSKIRRGIMYHCSDDGSKTWCQRCFMTLPAVIPRDDSESPGAHYKKKDLLKRRNDEDIVERWLTCRECGEGVHECCAFANEFDVDSSTFECPSCRQGSLPIPSHNVDQKDTSNVPSYSSSEEVYSYVTGNELPEKMKHSFEDSCFDCRTLPSCQIAEFVESKLQKQMVSLSCPPHAEKTIKVKVISNCEKTFQVPDVVKRHFRNADLSKKSVTIDGVSEFNGPPGEVNYDSKAIVLFQRIDGMDVCLFCMFVQEYKEDDQPNNKRVYIAYIDSVDHFRPRQLRTDIYHEMLVAYLASARARGFQHAHIWACPPSRGNSFVFWGHPSSQRTPTKERLLSWYHHAIHHGINRGVITDVKSLYEYSFQEFDNNPSKAKGEVKNTNILPCPPLLEGDYWIEEAHRLHSNCVIKFFRAKNTFVYNEHEAFNPEELFEGNYSTCPAMHVVTVLRNDIMLHPLAAPFCRPVNANALKLHDYHVVIKKPIDLGTVTTQCLLGEYDTFSEVFDDIKLVFHNAMKYNPPGHFIHSQAIKLLDYCEKQFETLALFWNDQGLGGRRADNDTIGIETFMDLSMSLGASISPKDLDLSFSTSNESKSLLSKMDLLTGGPEAIAKKMVGEDVWLLDKRHAHKPAPGRKKPKKEPKKCPGIDGMLNQHHSWLSDDLAVNVKRLRTDFFVCELYQDDEDFAAGKVKDEDFATYIDGFDFNVRRNSCSYNTSDHSILPGVADTRHGFLEFAQYRNFQFDTVRRAKYSTAMLLMYLQHDELPGVIPCCTSCKNEIVSVKWRKVNRAFDERRRSSQTPAVRMTSVEMGREELCSPCYESLGKKENHIPIRVSFKRRTR